jgi:hypothetical protein
VSTPFLHVARVVVYSCKRELIQKYCAFVKKRSAPHLLFSLCVVIFSVLHRIVMVFSPSLIFSMRSDFLCSSSNCYGFGMFAGWFPNCQFPLFIICSFVTLVLRLLIFLGLLRFSWTFFYSCFVVVWGYKRPNSF